MPDQYAERVAALLRALPTISGPDVFIGVLTLALLILWPRVTASVPAPLVAISVAAIAAFALTCLVPGFSVNTIKSRFAGGIPQQPPQFVLPWRMGGVNADSPAAMLEYVRGLLSSAFVIAMLGAIESLLSAVVADGMTGRKHDPDAELIGQDVGNIVAPFFGGFAATGAIARTATNIRCGARSPIAAVTHGVFVLLAVLFAAPLLGYLPMAALAALLMVVAWNMSEARHFVHTIRIAPVSDVLVLLTCFGLTVLFDMVIAVSVGVVLAALLFMRGMAELSHMKLVSDVHPALDLPLPQGVMLYEIAGPLFFGAAQKAMSALHSIEPHVRCIVIDMDAVPSMDATGLVNFESTVQKLHKSNVFVILGGVQPQPRVVMEKAGLTEQPGKLAIRESFSHAVALARAFSVLRDEPPVT